MGERATSRARMRKSVVTANAVPTAPSSTNSSSNHPQKVKTKKRIRRSSVPPGRRLMIWLQDILDRLEDGDRSEWSKILAVATLLIYSCLTLSGYCPLPKQGELVRSVRRRLTHIRPGRYKYLPTSSWPFTLKNHPEQFESILHPGDEETPMAVPKFFSPPIHQGKLMSRDLALHVGSCAKPDALGSHMVGDYCENNDRTIFIMIASYRDYQCRMTVESLFQRAAHPERLRVGVVDQIVAGIDVACDVPIQPCEEKPDQALCKYKDQVDVFEVEAQLSLGPVFARHLGNRMYRGEYYAMQTDAHITFVQDWDSDIINQHESTDNEMAVLSTYLSDIRGSIDENGNSLRKTRPVMCNTIWQGGQNGKHLEHDEQPESKPKIKGSPQLEPWWGAGFSFSRGHFVVNVPYDAYLPMIFQGEEMSITIRGFTAGYDFYTPERSVCFHHYERKHEPSGYFYENEKKYDDDLKVGAMKRLLGIVRMNPEVDTSIWSHRDEHLYGLGGVRSPETFYKTMGIDVVNKTAERHMCYWVDNGGDDGMHKIFTPHLRDDGMGIDYEKVGYVFKDPRPDDNDDQESEEDDDEENDDDGMSEDEYQDEENELDDRYGEDKGQEQQDDQYEEEAEQYDEEDDKYEEDEEDDKYDESEGEQDDDS